MESALRWPFWLLCEHWHLILVRRDQCTSSSPSHKRTRGSAIGHIFSLYRKEKTQQHFLEFFCFLDSRKKNKTEKEATFLYRSVLGLENKTRRGNKNRKPGYTIFSHCRRSQQINSTRLQTHSSKATFLSESQASTEEWKESEKERRQIQREGETRVTK